MEASPTEIDISQPAGVSQNTKPEPQNVPQTAVMTHPEPGRDEMLAPGGKAEVSGPLVTNLEDGKAVPNHVGKAPAASTEDPEKLVPASSVEGEGEKLATGEDASLGEVTYFPRPDGALEGVKPIAPGDQKPRKPRGRKPGQGRGRGRGGCNGKKTGRGKGKVEEDEEAPMDDPSESPPTGATGSDCTEHPRRRRRSAAKEEKTSEKRRSRKQAEDAKPSHQVRKTKGKRKQEAEVEDPPKSEGVAVEGKKKRRSFSSCRSPASASATTTCPTSVATTPASSSAPSAASSSNGKACRKSKGKKRTKKDGKVKSVPNTSEELDKKKIQSRKSSAYHTAMRAALRDGKTPDEAKALAKEVPCMDFIAHIRRDAVCVLVLESYLHSVFLIALVNSIAPRRTTA